MAYLWAGGPGRGVRKQCLYSQQVTDLFSQMQLEIVLPVWFGKSRWRTCGQKVQHEEYESNVGTASRRLTYPLTLIRIRTTNLVPRDYEQF
jgi:hypothetical protein